MSKFTTTLKGLMALALGSFYLSASALPTISPAPTGGAFAENTTWYYWDAPRKGGGFIANDDSYRNAAKTQFVLSNTLVPEGDAGLWCIVGNETDGYQFYNKAAGTDKVFGVESTGGAGAKSNMYTDGTTGVTTRFLFVDGEGDSAGNYIIKLKRDDSGIRILNDRNEVEPLYEHNLALWEDPSGNGWKSNDGSTFRFREEVSTKTLPENFLTTDESNPNYFFIKNLRKDNNKYIVVNDNRTAIGSMASISSNESTYNDAGALWYFVADGDARALVCGDKVTRYVTPVKIKNLIRPGRNFHQFNTTYPFIEEGRTYYLFVHTDEEGTTGFAIMKSDGANPTSNVSSWHLPASGDCTYWKSVGATGSLFDFEEADKNKIAGTELNYLVGVKNSLKNTISLVDKVMGTESSAIPDDVKNSIDGMQKLSEVEGVTNSVMSVVTPLLNRKVVYVVSNGRKADNKSKYIYLDPATGESKAANHKCVRGKWQFVQNGTGNSFMLRNISTDRYWSVNAGNTATSELDCPRNQYTFKLIGHKDGEGFVLKYISNNSCMYINNADTDKVNFTVVADPSNVSERKYSFSFEPANINETELEAAVSDDDATNDYFVIRSRLGKYEEDSYYFNENVKYPGSLVTAYPADRELARKRAGSGYHNGAHLEMYSPGSVWKFVKDGEGWKIYSLIGAQKEGGNKGLKVVDYDGTEYVDVAAEPTTFYLKAITASADEFATPDTYALCTAKEGGKYVTVSDTNDHGDYFLTLSATAPTTNAQDPAAFLIESIGEIHDGVNPEKEYVDYAKELHMFKSIAPVLDAEDMEYILAEKGDYKDNLNSITTIAQANEFMALGDMTASSRAFQRLDGKMIRLQNRALPTYYLFSNTAVDAQYNNPLAGTANLGDDQTLTSIWVVELPESAARTTDDAARMRQFRLRNLATGSYVMSNLQTGTVEKAQTLTVRRRTSLDGNDFFLALTKDYERNTALKFDRNENGLYTTTWGANSEASSHWTPELAVSTTAPTVTLIKNQVTDKYILTVAAPDGATMTPTGITWIGNATIEETPAANGVSALALDGVTDVTLTETSGNYTAEFEGLGSTDTDKHYTVKLPAGMFAIGNNVSPAVTANLTLAKETSTGIREVNAAEKGADVIYDLQGRRVSKASKGVYIINGVKTLVK